MENKVAKKYIEDMTKASTYFIFRNGPIKELYKNSKINDDDMREIQIYLQNHLAYLYTILLEENDVNKFNMIVSMMNKFFVNDETEVTLDDAGFNKMYESLFKATENLSFK